MRFYTLQTLFLTVVLLASPAVAAEKPVSELSNSEAAYVSLRGATLNQAYSVDGLTLQRDIGVIRLDRGRVSFAVPVLDNVVLGVFTGEGEFLLQPTLPWEKRNLSLFLDREAEVPEVREKFSSAVFAFTDDTFSEIQAAGSKVDPDPRATDVLKKLRGKLRDRRERPRSMTEAILTNGDMDNLEADILRDLYNPARRGFFNAYIFGNKLDDLRYFVRPRGALPQMNTPEEVALINFDPGNEKDGVWYLAHFFDEYEGGRGDSGENHSAVVPTHYSIETRIQKNRKIDGETTATFTTLYNGERILKLSLLPELRVLSVKNEAGEELSFIQESRKEDGSFYVVLTKPLEKGQERKLSIEYFGEDVVKDAGGGNFYVSARSSWYPNLGSFKDRATYELVFEYPKKRQLVSVGKLISEDKADKDFKRAVWRSDFPLTVAGFNYGDYKKKEVTDKPTETVVEGWATKVVPDFLRAGSLAELATKEGSRSGSSLAANIGSMSPTKMMEKAMAEAQMSMRLFTQYYGPLPYGRIAVTQQPQFGSGQSWPTLVYLPVSAFLDSTQRWALLGRNTFSFSRFVQEVTPHEVAHQWWGHIVGWESYHDQWISEGFSDFSASLYLQATQKSPAAYHKFLERSRETILEKNKYGYSANEVGPLWMGLRLRTPRTGSAYRKLIYPKGGYVLHMLRWMMKSPDNGDQPFIDMMHDFVKSHYNKNATTESFHAVVQRHMTPLMDAEGNGKIDWFFRQWVYGTEAPSYELNYKLTPTGSGGAHLSATIVQSGVSDSFVMPAPIYAQIGEQLVKLGSANMKGSSTSVPIEVDLPRRPDRMLINANYDILAEKSEANEL